MSGFGNRNISGLRWSLAQGLSYQFITTGPSVTTYTSGSVQVFKGSAVRIIFPDEVDFTKIKVIATGSTLEEIPGNPPQEVSDSTQLITYVKKIIQAQLIPLPLYYYYKDFSEKEKYVKLLYSWASVPGRIYNAGVYMLAPAFSPSDKLYDAAPTKITGRRVVSRMPDADWPHDTCILTVESETFGSREFIVMVDASSRFYCWPTVYDNSPDEFLYPPDSPYINQSIKTNVSDTQVISLIPPFPSWVYVPVDQRRDTDYPMEVNSGEPRYVWRFHPQGTKVVGIVLRREELTDADIFGRVTANQEYIPYEQVDTGFDLGIDTNQRSAAAVLDYTGPIKSDWPGYVEFSISISITGENKEDFTFSMSLTRQQQATETRYPVAADYLTQITKGWESYSVSAEPGDLLVMDVRSYIDERSELWIQRECGYKGNTADKVRQTWLVVNNEETSTEVIKFLTKDQPADFRTKQFYLNTKDLYSIKGMLKSINLSNLSFVYEARRRKHDVDEESYLTVTGRDYNVNYNNFKLFQRRITEQVGIRYYVFGQMAKEVVSGPDLELFETLDSIVLFDDPIQFSPLTVDTKWLYSRSIVSGNAFPSHHWLAQYIGNPPSNDYPAVGFWFNYVDLNKESGLIEDEVGIAASLLNHVTFGFNGGVLTFNSGAVKDTFSVPSQGWGLVGGYQALVGTGYISNESDFPYTLSEGCSTVDESYFYDVLVPWVFEVYQSFMEINTLNYEDHVIYSDYLSDGPPHPEEFPPNYDWIVQDTDPETGQLWGIHRVYSDGSLSQLVPNPGYKTCNNVVCSHYSPFNRSAYEAELAALPFGWRVNLHYMHLNFGIREWLAKDYSFNFAAEDFYRTDLDNNDLNHPHLRVYDYPIGAEWMMREWNESIVLDANFSLAVSPEGYYAGALSTPSMLEQTANASLYGQYVFESVHGYHDWSKVPHFNNWSINYTPYGNPPGAVTIPLQHYSLRDATFTSINIPSASDYGFINIDMIGHIDSSESTSHAATYELVYDHPLQIPNPSISISTSDDFFLPRKTITHGSGSVTVDLFSNNLTFYEPRPNGSMLFFNG